MRKNWSTSDIGKKVKTENEAWFYSKVSVSF